jgi:hypothetical protein
VLAALVGKDAPRSLGIGRLKEVWAERHAQRSQHQMVHRCWHRWLKSMKLDEAQQKCQATPTVGN